MKTKKYCFVIIDAHTKWIEVFPCARSDALILAKASVKEMIPRYGIPERI